MLLEPERIIFETLYSSCHVCLSACLPVCLLHYSSLHDSPIALKTIPCIQCQIKIEKYVGFSLKLPVPELWCETQVKICK